MRYHSLDALRAAMMLLGLVLHSAASYIHAAQPEAWPFHDPPGSVVFAILLVFIHLFRMPAFFLVAGFFGALLYQRDGRAGFLRNRVKRVGLPLPIFMVTVLPLAGLGFVFSAWREGVPFPSELLPPGPIWQRPIFGHLWFLYDLLILYLLAALVIPITRRLPPGWRALGSRTFRVLAGNAAGTFAMGLVMAITLLPMQGPGLETSAAIVPPARILIAYGVFFVFGWCLFSQRDQLLPKFSRGWPWFIIAGLVVFIAYVATLAAEERTPGRQWHVLGAILAGLATWFLIHGITGFFVRRMDSPRPAVRYLADASYWMYLTHLVPITWMSGVLAPSSAPPVMKFAIVLAVTTATTLITYRWWVRSTALGVLLNGRRCASSRAGSEDPAYN
jgi:surface polysaccharide O-acyltransferase-like enzyme